MANIDPRAAENIQPDLLADEKMYWAGRPNPRVIFHSEDLQIVPFSTIWTAFIVFCEWQSRHQEHGGSEMFSSLWGIPFLLFGNYMLWGRFIRDAWLKRWTYYAITNRRVIGKQRHKFLCAFLNEIAQMELEDPGSSTGTIWFGPRLPVIGHRGSKKQNWSRFSMNEMLVFADIEDARGIYRLTAELRAKAGSKFVLSAD